ncbi:MAG TPA: hypothetical protein VF420_15475 [Casimicrobiaceae bacterium]
MREAPERRLELPLGYQRIGFDQTQAVTKSFDAVMQTRQEYANRISYVIAPDGSIVFHYMNLNPNKHVEKMLDALRKWSAKGSAH